MVMSQMERRKYDASKSAFYTDVVQHSREELDAVKLAVDAMALPMEALRYIYDHLDFDSRLWNAIFKTRHEHGELVALLNQAISES